MGIAKVAVSLDERALARVDRLVEEGESPSRSRLLQDAVAGKLERMRTTRRAVGCAKLDPVLEPASAEEGLSEEVGSWPEY